MPHRTLSGRLLHLPFMLLKCYRNTQKRGQRPGAALYRTIRTREKFPITRHKPESKGALGSRSRFEGVRNEIE